MKFFERTYDDYWQYESPLGEFLNEEMDVNDVDSITDLDTETLHVTLIIAQDELEQNMQEGKSDRQSFYVIVITLAELYRRGNINN